MEDKDKKYFYLPHKEYCDLMFNLEEKDNQKRSADQLKILAAYKEALADSDSNTIPRVTHTNKARTDALFTRKKNGNNIPNVVLG